MDTKSRNIRYSSWFKLLAALLCVAGALAAGWGLRQAGQFYLAFTPDEYARSNDAAMKLLQVYSDLSVYPLRHASEEAVRGGAWVNDDQVRDVPAEETYHSRLDEAEQRYGDMIARAQQDGNDIEVANLLAGKQAYQNEIKQQYEAAKAEVRQRLIDEELAGFRAAQRSLHDTNGVYYYARTAAGKIVENIGGAEPESFFRGLPLARQFGAGGTDEYQPFGPYGYALPPDGAVVWVGLSQAAFSAGEQAYLGTRAQGEQGLLWFSGGLAALLLGLCWLAYAAGRRPQAEGVHLIEIDRVWLDVGLALLALLLFLGGAAVVYLMNSLAYMQQSGTTALYVLGGVLLAAMACCLMLYVTSAAKRVKRREFLRHTAIYKVCAWIARLLRGLMDGWPLAVRAVLWFCGYALASCLLLVSVIKTGESGGGFFFAVGALMLIALQLAALVILVKQAGAFKLILYGTKHIRSGNLTHRVPEHGIPEFRALAGNINSIAEGMDAALVSQLKAERMKAELITNVSHDLKTPLTSIITYIDLLKAEGPGSERAPEYIRVLDAKAQRLKALTEDLFEAAKAASGSIKPSIARLDAAELITQGLGELADRIRESGLDFRCSLPGETLYVMADGKLLWRVIENLLSNVFKYALPQSRVYISAAADGGKVRVTVKNISAFELNIPAEELMERFTRGDRARQSEGSGLGLAIAKSLTELQGGQFRIEIDGDLFKAIVEFAEA